MGARPKRKRINNLSDLTVFPDETRRKRRKEMKKNLGDWLVYFLIVFVIFLLIFLMLLGLSRVRITEHVQQPKTSETTATEFSMDPPKVEVMSEGSEFNSEQIVSRYIKIDGKLAILTTRDSGGVLSVSIAFVPPDCGESEKTENGNG